MKRISIVLVVISIFASCSIINATLYSGFIVNESSASEILVEYETLDGNESVILHNNLEKIGAFETIYESEMFAGEKEKYTQEEFESVIYSVKLSIVNGNDTIPLSKDFAPFENWEYQEYYDDFIMNHEYFLTITDEMLD
ncbi:MAG: hypothetical protein AB8G11_13260 [Saprospiraceae bacterium]